MATQTQENSPGDQTHPRAAHKPVDQTCSRAGQKPVDLTRPMAAQASVDQTLPGQHRIIKTRHVLVQHKPL